jgi:photosystem II stability/assembly factor-like uncharacterized protein
MGESATQRGLAVVGAHRLESGRCPRRSLLGRGRTVYWRSCRQVRCRGKQPLRRTLRTGYRPNSRLVVSTDGARTFRYLGLDTSDRLLSSVRCAPSQSGTIYAASQAKLLRSTDGGRHWSQIVGPNLRLLSIDPHDPNHLLGLTFKDGNLEIAESFDGGTTQRLLDRPIVFTCETRFSNAWIVPGTRGEFIFSLERVSCLPGVTGTGFGHFTQGQGKWKPIPSEDANSWSGTVEMSRWPQISIFSGDRVWISPDAGETWTQHDLKLPGVDGLSSVVRDPKANLVLYGVGVGQMWHYKPAMRSDDGGLSWRVMEGVPGSAITIAADQVQAGWVYVSTWDGLYASHDGGKTWLLAEGLWDNEVYAVTVDPTDSQTVYAGNARGELFKTKDGGQSWRHTDRGLPRKPIWDIAIEVTRPSRLIAGTGDCVWRSEDAGDSWKRGRCIVPAGMYPPQVQVYELAKVASDFWFGASQFGVLLSPDDGRSWLRLYSEPSLTVKARYPWEVLAGSSKGLLSIAGDSWLAALWCCPPTDGKIQAIVVDSHKPRFMAFSLVARSYESSERDLGLWKTDEGSVGYCRSMEDDVLSLAVSPGSPYLLYAGTRAHGLLVSFDQGLTWAAGLGLEKGPVFHIAVDPLRPDCLYAATDTGVYVSRDSGISWILTLDSTRFPIRPDLPARDVSKQGPF